MMKAQPKKTVIANWKTNLHVGEGVAFSRAFRKLIEGKPVTCDVMIAPPATHLVPMQLALHGTDIKLVAQNCHFTQSGAYTGEISPHMLKSAGCYAVIIGHSERRNMFGETNGVVRVKVAAALEAGLKAIVCVGESKHESEAEDFDHIITERLLHSIPPHISADDLMVSYEPLWSIGTGLIPTLDRISRVHLALKQAIDPSLKVFYGGSVTSKNAKEILSTPGVDGVLVGGASLNPESFFAICESCP